ncbi:efflux RND transporter periplasmic adaptor subunit [Comamonas composti]|uniref:efflux RND transporter periplasmic adaptor subunit n=1 Tax=Comamonas composti TaxID=408558 RepID=UPI0003FF5228|nr:biotin/lipoyl-binding protein [Comamonas composti]
MSTRPASAASAVAQLEARARAANSPLELAFSIANDSFGLLGFRQAFVMAGSGAQARLLTLSGLAPPTEDSPYLIWLRRSWPWVQEHVGASGGWLVSPLLETSEDVGPELKSAPAEIADGWLEWWPQGIYALPLRRRDGAILAWAAFLLDEQPDALHQQALQHLAVHWGYCWEMLGGKPRPSLRQRWKAMGRKRHAVWLALVVLCLLPVRQSALAPAEIVALDATTVAAALDGVVKTFHVRPNQAVRQGDLLLSLDETTLRNRLDVATQSVAVADAEWMAASQKAFDNLQSKGELTQLQGRAQEKRAELAAVQAQLDRIHVLAPHDGIAVFGAADDWLGRPVVTGERIMQVANPESAGVLIYMPVADALVLEENAPLKLFLTVRPLSPLRATVTETSYQSTLSPDNVASYRLRATLDPGQSLDDARIGLHGTAKVSGNWVVLIYYVLRRPLATLREWSGW